MFVFKKSSSKNIKTWGQRKMHMFILWELLSTTKACNVYELNFLNHMNYQNLQNFIPNAGKNLKCKKWKKYLFFCKVEYDPTSIDVTHGVQFRVVYITYTINGQSRRYSPALPFHLTDLPTMAWGTAMEIFKFYV